MTTFVSSFVEKAKPHVVPGKIHEIHSLLLDAYYSGVKAGIRELAEQIRKDAVIKVKMSETEWTNAKIDVKK